MGRAYAWSGGQPERRERYDLAVTAVTVLVAVGIGGIELAAVASEHLRSAGPLELAGSIDLAPAGPAIAATFALLWGAAALLHRRGSRRAGLGA
jgi:high-affinity nickel-transport protein